MRALRLNPVCCVLRAACCVLRAACGVLCAVCCVLCAAPVLWLWLCAMGLEGAQICA